MHTAIPALLYSSLGDDAIDLLWLAEKLYGAIAHADFAKQFSTRYKEKFDQTQ
jgi:hypothetical protein